MLRDSNSGAVSSLDRINLRLSAQIFAAIDAARCARPGSISRNTWITEAIAEKLKHEDALAPRRPSRARG